MPGLPGRWPSSGKAGQSGELPAWDTKRTPLPGPQSACVLLQWEATNIEYLAFVFKRVIVSRMLTFVIVSAKVI